MQKQTPALLLAFGLFAGFANDAPACIPFHGDVLQHRRMHLDRAKAISGGLDDAARVRLLAEETLKMVGEKSVTGMPVSSIPEGTKLHDVQFPKASAKSLGSRVNVVLDLPDDFLKGEAFTAYRMYLIGSEFRLALFEEDFSEWYLMVRDPKSGEIIDFNDLLPPDVSQPMEPEWDEASAAMSRKLGKPETRPIEDYKRAPVIQPGLAQGALSGKTIYINQSHGWFDDYTVVNRWRVQRTAAHNVLEDFDSASFNNMYVLPLLRNAGAKVQTVRESDLQTNMVIVDNADSSTLGTQGRFYTTGTWTISTINGFRQKTTPAWTGTTINPFNQGAGANILSPVTTGSAPTATAVFVANIPADGYYNVYASWTAFSARARDARYRVHHSGGISEVRVDQRIDGYTWNLLGNFYFEKNAPETERQVVLTNQTTDTAATNVSADAVRWGGGMGDMNRHTSGVSGRPRWEEEAVNYLQFNGFGYSGTLYAGDDDEGGGWSDRPQYARWEHSEKDASVEDALYFAFHTNAANGTARGISTFRHDTATAASISFQTIMHDTMYAHVAGLFVPGWTVRSKSVTNFGENNQSSMGTGLPGFLIEGLFHDTQADAEMYSEPEFRYAYARSMVDGILKYYEARDRVTLTRPPEPPTHFRVEARPNNTIVLSWNAPPARGTGSAAFLGNAATSYRVQVSRNGFGFDDGRTAAGTSLTITDIPEGSLRFFRVIAVNAGGISIPTETLAARTATTAASSVLIVNGFDRNQRTLIPIQTITNAGGPTFNNDWRRFQAFNYSIEHAKALEPIGVRISSASNEAIAADLLPMSRFNSVFWILGEESTTDETFSAAEQTRVNAFLALPSRSFFASGSEIGWDLGTRGTAADISFLSGSLKATMAGDDAGTYNVVPAAGGPFAGLSTITFSTASGARFDAEFPDQLTATGGSAAALTYSGGTAGTAGVFHNNGTSKTILLGFPFETIGSATARAQVMERVAGFFGLFDGREVIDPVVPPVVSPQHPTGWMMQQ